MRKVTIGSIVLSFFAFFISGVNSSTAQTETRNINLAWYSDIENSEHFIVDIKKNLSVEKIIELDSPAIIISRDKGLDFANATASYNNTLLVQCEKAGNQFSLISCWVQNDKINLLFTSLFTDINQLENCSTLIEKQFLYLQNKTDLVSPPAPLIEPHTDAATVKIPDYKFEKEFAVLRSDSINGTYERLGVTTSGDYSDKSAIPGNEYFYCFENTSEPVSLRSQPVAGYRTPLLPHYYSVQEMTSLYNRPRPAYRTNEERVLAEKHLAYLKQEYMHFTKLRIMMMLSTPYLRRGDLVILSGLKKTNLDRDNSTAYLRDEKETYEVVFNSGRFFRFLRDIPDEVFLNRLVSNGFAYCMFSRFVEIRQENGHYRYIPQYDAFGLSTQYFQYDRDWQSNTVMLGTSDDELKKRMSEAQKRGSR